VPNSALIYQKTPHELSEHQNDSASSLSDLEGTTSCTSRGQQTQHEAQQKRLVGEIKTIDWIYYSPTSMGCVQHSKRSTCWGCRGCISPTNC